MLGGEGFEGWEAGVEVGDVELLDGAGGDWLCGGAVGIRGGEGGGKVLDEERKTEAVLNSDSDDEVQVVLRRVLAYDDGIGLEDGMGGIDGGLGDGDIGDGVRGEVED